MLFININYVCTYDVCLLIYSCSAHGFLAAFTFAGECIQLPTWRKNNQESIKKKFLIYIEGRERIYQVLFYFRTGVLVMGRFHVGNGLIIGSSISPESPHP
jgi:hypothetical protein